LISLEGRFKELSKNITCLKSERKNSKHKLNYQSIKVNEIGALINNIVDPITIDSYEELKINYYLKKINLLSSQSDIIDKIKDRFKFADE
jgi:hypothetical protein